MNKIKIMCTEQQRKRVKKLINLGYLSAIACDCIYKVDVPTLSLDDFEFIILKDGEKK